MLGRQHFARRAIRTARWHNRRIEHATGGSTVVRLVVGSSHRLGGHLVHDGLGIGGWRARLRRGGRRRDLDLLLAIGFRDSGCGGGRCRRDDLTGVLVDDITVSFVDGEVTVAIDALNLARILEGGQIEVRLRRGGLGAARIGRVGRVAIAEAVLLHAAVVRRKLRLRIGLDPVSLAAEHGAEAASAGPPAIVAGPHHGRDIWLVSNGNDNVS